LLFNIQVTNPNSLTQIDSLDLNEPTNATYLKSFTTEFPNFNVDDIQIGTLTIVSSTSSSSSTSIPNTTGSPTDNKLSTISSSPSGSIVNFIFNLIKS
jgi:hypothetical protein